MKKNVIITGASGQDGQILARILKKKKKYKVYCFFNKKKPKILKKITYKKQDLSSKKKLDFFFKKNKPDIVLHLAAHNPSYSENNNLKFFNKNFQTTKNIFFSTFNSNKKAKFVFCSSSQIFLNKKSIVSENSRVAISNAYTKFRIKSDKLMLDYKKKNKIMYTNAILFNHDSIYRNQKFLIPRIIKAIINKNNSFLNNIVKTNIASDFSHAEDICMGIYKIMISKVNFDKVILSSGLSTNINKIITYIIFKYKLKLKINMNKNKNKKTLIGNNYLAKKKLKWSPKKNIFIAAEEIYKSLAND